MLWAIFAFLSLATCAGLILPVISRKNHEPLRLDYDLEVYRVQMAEIDKDRTRGLLDDKDAAAARFEIQRRILTSGENISNDNRQDKSTIVARIAAIAIILLALPGASFGIYHYVGAPQMAGLDNASFANTKTQEYTQRGDGFFANQQYEKAADAYKKAIGLDPKNGQAWTSLGECLALLEGGTITEDAQAAFAHGYLLNPQDTKAEFSLAVADAQAGDYRRAVGILHDVQANSPKDAPWNSTVDQEITRFASEGKFDASSIKATPPTQDIKRLLNISL